MRQELVEAAREDLMKRLASDEALKEEAARLICDDLAHARHLRTVVMEAAEHLTATSLRDSVIKNWQSRVADSEQCGSFKDRMKAAGGRHDSAASGFFVQDMQKIMDEVKAAGCEYKP